jgi:hypothetical protein
MSEQHGSDRKRFENLVVILRALIAARRAKERKRRILFLFVSGVIIIACFCLGQVLGYGLPTLLLALGCSPELIVLGYIFLVHLGISVWVLRKGFCE